MAKKQTNRAERVFRGRTMTTYRTKKLGRLLRRGEARITGRVSLGQHWPDEPHAWVVDDLVDRKTYHVKVADRPSWSRYEDPEQCLPETGGN